MLYSCAVLVRARPRVVPHHPSFREAPLAGNTEAGRLFVRRARIRAAVAIGLAELTLLRQDVEDAQRLLNAGRLVVGTLGIREITVQLCKLPPHVGLAGAGSAGCPGST